MKFFKKIRRRAAYSMTEIVVAMAIIVMLTAVGLTACYVATKIQSVASKNLNIVNAAEAFRSSFVAVCDSIEKYPENDNDVIDFLDAYNARMAFVLDVYNPTPRSSYTGEYALSIVDEYGNYVGWKRELVLESETISNFTLENGEIVESDSGVVVYSGLNFSYEYNYESGNKYYTFTYYYYTTDIEITATLTLSAASREIEIEGRSVGSSSASYTKTIAYAKEEVSS